MPYGGLGVGGEGSPPTLFVGVWVACVWVVVAVGSSFGVGGCVTPCVGRAWPHCLIVTSRRSAGIMVGMKCSVCGRVFVWSGRGRRPSACGARCRKRRSRAAALPAALTGSARWCARVGKRPVQVSGRAASSTDRSTWTTYAAVRSRDHGIMLGDGIACWDLDGVLDDGELHPDAEAVLAEVGDGALWIERSMSGRGLHVFVHGDGRSHQGEHVSYYSHSRFIAVTGDRWSA